MRGFRFLHMVRCVGGAHNGSQIFSNGASQERFLKEVIGKCRSFFWSETGALNVRVNGNEPWGESVRRDEATVAEVFDRNHDQH